MKYFGNATGRSGRTPVVVATLVTAGALALTSACGSAGSSGTSGDTPGVSGKTITLGVSEPLTGKMAVYHEAGRGLSAYFDYRNDGGGIEGYQVKIKSVDNQGTVTGGASAMRQLLGEQPFAAEVTTTPGFSGAQSVVKQQAPDMPLFVLANGAAVAKAGMPNAFGLVTGYTTESHFGIRYIAKTLGKKKIALLYDPAATAGSAESAPGYAKKQGAEIVAKIAVPASTTNYVPIVQQIQSSGAQAVEIMLAVPAVAGVKKAAEQKGYGAPFVAYSSDLDKALIKLGGSSVEGMYISALFPATSTDTRAVKEFNTQIAKYDSKAANPLGLVGWNAGAVIAEALEDVIKSDKDLTRDAFTDALYGLSGEPVGVLKSLGWSHDKHASIDGGQVSSFTMYQIKGSQFTPVTK